MRFFLIAGIIPGLLLLTSGCNSPLMRKINPLSGINRKDKPASKPLAAQDEATGIIEMSRPAEGYVLLRLNGKVPPEDMELECYTSNAPSGKIKFTGERKGPFLAADILEGKPNKGDLVVLRGGRRIAGRENGPSAADQLATNLPPLTLPPDGSGNAVAAPASNGTVAPPTSVTTAPAPLAKPAADAFPVAHGTPPVESGALGPSAPVPVPAAAQPERSVPPPLPDWVIEAQKETPIKKN